MINKDNAYEYLPDYINNNLSESEHKQIEILIEENPELQAELATMRRENRLFKDSFDDPFEDARLTNISANVMREIRAGKKSSLANLSPTWRSYLRAAAAILLMIICFGIFLMLKPKSLPTSEQKAENLQAPVEALQTQEDENEAIKMTFATSNPKIKIIWTMSKDIHMPNEEKRQ